MLGPLGKALDAVFIIGLLVNVVKLADLILRPHQQKRLQEWCEGMTVRLEDLKPLGWFQILGTAKASRILLFIGFLEFFVVALLAGLAPSHGDRISTDIRIVQGLAILLSFASMPYILRRAGPRMMTWLFANQKPWIFVRRYAISVVFGLVALFLYQGLLWLLLWIIFHNQTSLGDFFDGIDNSRSPARWGLMAGLLLCWPFFTFFWIAIQVGALALWCVVILAIAEGILKLARAIAWRLVEYNKGVFAALTLIATAAVGIADLIVKTQHTN
jgi:hypothetical protein